MKLNKEKDLMPVYYSYSKRSLKSAINIELKAMASRIELPAGKQISLNQSNFYVKAYEKYPDQLKRIKQETNEFKKDIYLLIDEAATSEGLSHDEVLVYLKQFPFMQYYEENG